MIHYFPLETNETRYTGHLDKSILSYLVQDGRPYVRYYPGTEGRAEIPPPPGSFFNVPGSIEFRSLQLAEFSRALGSGEVNNGDIVFLSDILMPGMESIGYLAHLQGIRLDYRGLLHGGSYIEDDLMHGAEYWARSYEEAIFALANEIYLGSEYHRDQVTWNRKINGASRLVVTGHLIDPDLPEQQPKDPIVVFNSRLSPDKQPWMFRALADQLKGEAEFVITLDRNLSKHDYYELLAQSSVVVSCATHETFGVGVQEAVKLGCIPVLPNRCCYPEQFDSIYLYNDFGEAAQRVVDALNGDLPVPTPIDYSHAVERWFA